MEWRERWSGHTPLLALPRDTQQVSEVVALCAEAGVAITPQGGNTGLVGGQIPQGEILLSTAAHQPRARGGPCRRHHGGRGRRHSRGRARSGARRRPQISPQPGLRRLGHHRRPGLDQRRRNRGAALWDRCAAWSWGSRRCCRTDEIWNGLKRLRKDNTGYDLKQLLIGAEGTLWASSPPRPLKLFPRFASRAVAIAGVASPAAALELLTLAKARTGEVEAFELMCALGVRLAVAHMPGARDPLAEPSAWCVLVETRGRSSPAGPKRTWSGFWRPRSSGVSSWTRPWRRARRRRPPSGPCAKDQSAAQKREGAAWKHDVSVPVSRVPEFLATAARRARRGFPGRARRRLRPCRRRQHPLRRARARGRRPEGSCRTSRRRARGWSTIWSLRWGDRSAPSMAWA